MQSHVNLTNIKTAKAVIRTRETVQKRGSVSLPGLPSGPLSPQQQKEAIERANAAAEQRVKLGMKLLRAAGAHTSHQQQLYAQLKAQQEQLRDQIQNDIASTLQTYDQWMAKFDQRFSTRLKKLEEKVDALHGKWAAAGQQIASMMRRAEELLNHAPHTAPPTTPAKPNKPSAKQPPRTAASVTPTAKPPTSRPQKGQPNAHSTTPPRPTHAHKPPANPKPQATQDTPPPTQITTPPKPQSNDMVYSKALEQLRKDSAQSLSPDTGTTTP